MKRESRSCTLHTLKAFIKVFCLHYKAQDKGNTAAGVLFVKFLLQKHLKFVLVMCKYFWLWAQPRQHIVRSNAATAFNKQGYSGDTWLTLMLDSFSTSLSLSPPPLFAGLMSTGQFECLNFIPGDTISQPASDGRTGCRDGLLTSSEMKFTIISGQWSQKRKNRLAKGYSVRVSAPRAQLCFPTSGMKSVGCSVLPGSICSSDSGSLFCRECPCLCSTQIC